MHKHRNLLAHAPEALHEEVSADYTDMIYVARPGDARHREQSLEPALGAGADGAQRRRPGAVPRHDGGLLPARPDDLRRAIGLLQRGLARPVAPKRVAFTADYNGRMPIDREVREICTKAARRFAELGCIVEEASPDIGAADEAFHILRASISSSIASCNSGATATN